MDLDHRKIAEASARKYIGTDRPLEMLGYGVEGFVFKSPTVTALKVFKHAENFARELMVYERLRECDVTRILGLNVPWLVGFDARLPIIEMTIVQPPYLLDFSQTTLDIPHEFTEEAMQTWWEGLAEDFGARLPIVRRLFDELQSRYGINYYDLAPRNVNFDGWVQEEPR